MAVSLNVVRGFFFFALGGLLFGYSIGVTGSVLSKGQLLCCRPGDACAHPTTKPAGPWEVGYSWCVDLSPVEVGAVSSMTLFGAVAALVVLCLFGDGLSRKAEALGAAALYVGGAGLAALAPVFWATLAGLLVYGVGVGLAMHAAPLYIAEVTPADVRGAFVGAKEAVIVLGIFLGFAVDILFGGMDQGWRLMLGSSAILGACMGLGVALLPRSPRWLALRASQQRGDALLGRPYTEEARQSLRFYRGGASDEDIERELESISVMDREPARWYQAFQYPWPLFIGCSVVLLQQISGQPSVLYFANTIFTAAGFADSAAYSSTGVGCVKLIATLLTVWRVDRYGRRVLLMTGIVMMLAALLVVAVGFTHRTCAKPVPVADCAIADVTLPSAWASAVVIALMVYVSGYQVGFGPIAWLLISEIFPLHVRGAAMSIAVFVNFGSNIIVTFSLDPLLVALTPPGVFFLYAAMSLLALVFVFFAVPETKGKTLEQIEEELTGRKPSQMPLSSLA